MNPDGHGFKQGDLTGKIIEVFYAVYNELGHGLLESVYEKAMGIALVEAGLRVECQKGLVVHFRGRVVGDSRWAARGLASCRRFRRSPLRQHGMRTPSGSPRTHPRSLSDRRARRLE